MTIKYTYSYTYILNTKFMLIETDDYLDATFTLASPVLFVSTNST